MKPTVRFAFLFTALFGLLAVSTALADDPHPSTQPTKGEQMIMSYDISDLLRNTSDYPLSTSSLPQTFDAQPGGGRLFSNGNPGVPQPSGPDAVPAADSMTPEAIVTLVKQMVLDQNANSSLVGHTIVVQGSGEVQTKMMQLLNSISQQQTNSSSAMVCTRVFWVSLSPAEVASIFDQVKASGKTNLAPMPTIPDSLIDATHLYCQAQTICFSGQTVHVISGRSQSYVSNVTPVVGTNAVGYSPTVSAAPSGVTVQIKPQLLPTGSALVDIASMVNESGAEMQKIDVAAGLATVATTQSSPPPGPSTIQAPNVVQQEFHTTVRLPVGKKILIGGMTLEPAAKDQAGRQLFLAMEVDAVQ